MCFVLRNKLDVPRVKHKKQYEDSFNSSAQHKAEKDSLFRYHKMRRSPKKVKEEKMLNISAVNDTLFLENSVNYSSQ